jgi:hypothetical protein
MEAYAPIGTNFIIETLSAACRGSVKKLVVKTTELER